MATVVTRTLLNITLCTQPVLFVVELTSSGPDFRRKKFSHGRSLLILVKVTYFTMSVAVEF